MRIRYTISKLGKYKVKKWRIGVFTLEMCLFKGKFLFRFEVNNWDKGE